jgi:hypothetical protein
MDVANNELPITILTGGQLSFRNYSLKKEMCIDQLLKEGHKLSDNKIIPYSNQ